MVKEKNAPLILASLSSILSFICLMVALQLPQNTSSNVLGTTSSNLVPCSVINNWQKLYCSNIGPTGTPSNIPTPRPTTYCKTGISSSVYGPTCIVSNIAKGNLYLKFTCYGGYSSVVGSEASCYTQSELMILANRVCSSRSPCSPTTKPPITPTRFPTKYPSPPTPTPTKYPSPAPTIRSTPTPAPPLKTITIRPQNNTFNPNSVGSVTYYVVPVSVTPNHSDFKFPKLYITGLVPNTYYQLFVCNPSGSSSCSSDTQALFTSDSSGSINIINTFVIGPVDTTYTSLDFRLYQPLPGGPVPTHTSSTCYYTNAFASPCLRGYFNL